MRLFLLHWWVQSKGNFKWLDPSYRKFLLRLETQKSSWMSVQLLGHEPVETFCRFVAELMQSKYWVLSQICVLVVLQTTCYELWYFNVRWLAYQKWALVWVITGSWQSHPAMSALQLEVQLPWWWTRWIWMNSAQMALVMKSSLYSHP